MSAMLEIEGLSVAYARKGLALDNVSLQVPSGGIVALLGANGAGKTTLIRAVTGLLDTHHGRIVQGAIRFAGRPINGMAPHRLVRLGLAQVPEGRLIFKQLTVAENLQIGAAVLPRGQLGERIEAVYELFPRLAERQRQAAGWLSGGEQQMLALGRALIGRPRLLLVDELSLGLAPLIVDAIYEQLMRVGQTFGYCHADRRAERPHRPRLRRDGLCPRPRPHRRIRPGRDGGGEPGDCRYPIWAWRKKAPRD